MTLGLLKNDALLIRKKTLRSESTRFRKLMESTAQQLTTKKVTASKHFPAFFLIFKTHFGYMLQKQF